MSDQLKDLVKRLAAGRTLLLRADGDRDLGFQSNITTDTSMALADELKSAIDAIEAMAGEVDTLEMKLAACTVGALSNTERTVKENRIGPDSPYWSVSLGDVYQIVDREMEARAERDRLAGEVEAMQGVMTHLKGMQKHLELCVEAERETGLRIAAERDRLKAEHDRHLADAIDAQADVKRLTAERDRLNDVLKQIETVGDWYVGSGGKCAELARKAREEKP